MDWQIMCVPRVGTRILSGVRPVAGGAGVQGHQSRGEVFSPPGMGGARRMRSGTAGGDPPGGAGGVPGGGRRDGPVACGQGLGRLRGQGQGHCSRTGGLARLPDRMTGGRHPTVTSNRREAAKLGRPHQARSVQPRAIRSAQGRA